MKSDPVSWFDIDPRDAVNLRLPMDNIVGPLTSDGTVCPWPWEPQTLVGVPLGMYHCLYCGEMVVAALPHGDYRDVG
jgi:hypothetical protein